MRKRLPIVALLVMILTLLTASQVLAAPTLIQGSLQAGYITGDSSPMAGVEIEFLDQAYFSYLYSTQNQTICMGYRYYVPIDEPYRVNISAGELIRFGATMMSYASYISAGFEYDPGWFFVGGELGAGIDYYYDEYSYYYTIRPLLLIQLKAGVHIHF